MSTIDREKLIEEMRGEFLSYIKYGLNERAETIKGWIDRIQSGVFDLRETETPTLKPGDRVRHRTNKHFILGEVLEISKTGKSAYVKWIEYDRKFRIFPPYPAYYTIKSLVKMEEPNHD